MKCFASPRHSKTFTTCAARCVARCDALPPSETPSCTVCFQASQERCIIALPFDFSAFAACGNGSFFLPMHLLRWAGDLPEAQHYHARSTTETGQRVNNSTFNHEGKCKKQKTLVLYLVSSFSPGSVWVVVIKLSEGKFCATTMKI